MAIKDLWWALNDKCWPLLDAVRVGDFFDKHNLPPILFPLMIILAVLALLWLFMAPAQAPPCGDGMCSAPKETYATCPADCPQLVNTSVITVTVDITDEVEDQITVKLFDSRDAQVGSEETKRSATFEFTNIPPQKLGAMVTCPNSKQQKSRLKSVDRDNSVITLTLPNDCFDYLTDRNTNEPIATFGTVFVTVSDTESGGFIDASVTAIRDSDGIAEATEYTNDAGSCTLNLRANERYYLIASAEGYEGYSGDADRFFILAGGSDYKIIQMQPLASASTTASVRVCAKSGETALAGGRISLSGPDGTEVGSAMLSSGSNGCVTFNDVQAGLLVRAALANPPAGCASPSPSGTLMVDASSPNAINIEVQCGQTGFVKVIVHDQQGSVLTNQTKITLWNAINRQQISGSAADTSLAMGQRGYTEEVTVPANTLIIAKAASSPIKFIDSVSGPAAFQPNEHGTIDIVLGERERGEFAFLGASIIYTPSSPGSPVKVFVQQITYNKTVLTPQNSNVVVLIDGQEFNTTFSSP